MEGKAEFSKDVENLIKSVQNKLLEVKYLSSTGEGKCGLCEEVSL